MADAYTGVGASSIDTAAFDLRMFYALRAELYFDSFATVKPTMQSHNGATVAFTLQTDLAAATSTLSESTDVSAVAMSDSQVTLTLAEYGNAALTTAKLRGTTFIPFDPIVANVIGYNAGLSIDTVACQVLVAGTNVSYSGQATSVATVIPTDILSGNDVRAKTAALRRAYVQPLNGYYLGVIHPDVSYDLRGATTGGNWRDPHTYSDPADIWNGEAGLFEGVRFLEVARVPMIAADAGSSTTNTDVYASLFLGQEALAKAHSMADGNGPLPAIVPGPVTDHLRRFVPMGWYWFGAYGIFRQAAVRVQKSGSSIGLNAASGTN